jgi:hypothetical protein
MAFLSTPLVFPLGGGGTVAAAADVWAQDLLTVTFQYSMKNDVFLQSVGAYSVTPLDDGADVNLVAVQTGNTIATRTVYLVVTPPTVGKLYEISFQPLYDIGGGSYAPDPCKFIGRPTKQDSIIGSRPQMYDMSPEGNLRKVLQAIGRQDDLIGGARKDKIF